MIMAATPQPQGKTENFFSKMGEKLNKVIDSVGVRNEPTQYLQLATAGMSSIPAEYPINQNVMKFQRIQNSLPQNIGMPSHIKKVKYAKADARTRTVAKFTPIFFGGDTYGS